MAGQGCLAGGSPASCSRRPGFGDLPIGERIACGHGWTRPPQAARLGFGPARTARSAGPALATGRWHSSSASERGACGSVSASRILCRKWLDCGVTPGQRGSGPATGAALVARPARVAGNTPPRPLAVPLGRPPCRHDCFTARPCSMSRQAKRGLFANRFRATAGRRFKDDATASTPQKARCRGRGHSNCGSTPSWLDIGGGWGTHPYREWIDGKTLDAGANRCG